MELLTHADENGKELGYLDTFDSLDIQVSDSSEVNDNTFELVMAPETWEEHPIEIGHRVFYQDSEYGGIVEGIRYDSADGGAVTITGLTWRGMLGLKAVRPPDGVQYIQCVGSLATVLSELIDDRFDGFIVAEEERAAIQVNRRSRHINLYKLIQLLLKDSGSKLHVVYDGAKVIIGVRPRTDYSEEILLNTDYGLTYVATASDLDMINHVMALGGGEGLSRLVLDFWRLEDGTIITDPLDARRPRGLLEKDYIYDYPNAEEEKDLIEGAHEKLKDLVRVRSIEINAEDAGLDLDIGDIVACADPITKLGTKAPIERQVVTIEDGARMVRYYVKED